MSNSVGFEEWIIKIIDEIGQVHNIPIAPSKVEGFIQEEREIFKEGKYDYCFIEVFDEKRESLKKIVFLDRLKLI